MVIVQLDSSDKGPTEGVTVAIKPRLTGNTCSTLSFTLTFLRHTGAIMSLRDVIDAMGGATLSLRQYVD